MRQDTRTVYTLNELRTAHPEAYAEVHERWKAGCAEDAAPWTDETMDSLKAVVKACGARLTDWSIGAWAPSHVCVDVSDETDDDEPRRKDAAWLVEAVLKPAGYADGTGAAHFPGLCVWTGYCADDAMIEAVHKALVDGDTLTEALEGLADVAREEMEANAEQQEEEDSMLANWSDREYTADGREA